MKTAIYIEQGITQLVLTPENDWEKSVVKSMTNGTQSVDIRMGEFYACRGGWVRHGTADDSLILSVGIKPEPPNP